MAESQGVPRADLQRYMEAAKKRFKRLQQLGVEVYALDSGKKQQIHRAVVQAASCSSSSNASTSSTALHSIRPCGGGSMTRQQQIVKLPHYGWRISAAQPYVARHVHSGAAGSTGNIGSRCY
eukprot:GHUV01023938.1.p1 GENE.GHUV01023938.1~~GHUV01023938.1.p1  ORF type:complete len:122 (+),score=34.90 GHUV01023938.1:432-797(+)